MINIRYYLRRKKYEKIILESQCQSVSEEDKQKNKIIRKTIQKKIYLRRQTKKEKYIKEYRINQSNNVLQKI